MPTDKRLEDFLNEVAIEEGYDNYNSLLKDINCPSSIKSSTSNKASNRFHSHQLQVRDERIREVLEDNSALCDIRAEHLEIIASLTKELEEVKGVTNIQNFT